MRRRGNGSYKRLATWRVPACTPPNLPWCGHLGHLAGQVADPADGGGALRHRNHATGLQQVEGVAALEHEIEGGRGQALAHQVTRLSLVEGEQLLQPLGIGGLEVVGALALLKGQPDVAVGAMTVPAEIPDALHVLENMARRSRP